MTAAVNEKFRRSFEALTGFFGGRGDTLTPQETADMISDCKHEVERLDGIITGFLAAIRPGRPHFENVDLRIQFAHTSGFLSSTTSIGAVVERIVFANAGNLLGYTDRLLLPL